MASFYNMVHSPHTFSLSLSLGADRAVERCCMIANAMGLFPIPGRLTHTHCLSVCMSVCLFVSLPVCVCVCVCYRQWVSGFLISFT